MKRWSAGALLSAGALAAWAGLFWWLLLSGRTSLYLSTRTAWLVPVGATLASTAALGRAFTAKTSSSEQRARRPAWRIGLIVMPVALAMAVPPATLSSYAVGRRSAFGGASTATSARVVAGPLDFVDVAAARSSDVAFVTLRARSGERITLEGFVTIDPALGADELLLTRFIVTCCVADATIAQVRVVGVPPARYATDDWVRVAGRVYAFGRDVLVVADQVRPIGTPNPPYLTP